MHLFLTDRLSCPRCGPEFGLILLAEKMLDRRVVEGELGCSNCREHYPIEGGFADLRMPPRTPLDPTPGPDISAEDHPQEPIRLAALLGVASGPGTLLLIGPAARYAGQIASLIDQVEVVGVDPSLRGMEEQEGVSRMVAWQRIPFFSESLRGVLVSGDPEGVFLGEAVRVVAPMGRVVLLGGGEDTRTRLQELGLTVLLEEGGVVVAVKETEKMVPLTTLRVP